jgi:hypothetical protein
MGPRSKYIGSDLINSRSVATSTLARRRPAERPPAEIAGWLRPTSRSEIPRRWRAEGWKECRRRPTAHAGVRPTVDGADRGWWMRLARHRPRSACNPRAMSQGCLRCFAGTSGHRGTRSRRPKVAGELGGCGVWVGQGWGRTADLPISSESVSPSEAPGQTPCRPIRTVRHRRSYMAGRSSRGSAPGRTPNNLLADCGRSGPPPAVQRPEGQVRATSRYLNRDERTPAVLHHDDHRRHQSVHAAGRSGSEADQRAQPQHIAPSSQALHPP